MWACPVLHHLQCSSCTKNPFCAAAHAPVQCPMQHSLAALGQLHPLKVAGGELSSVIVRQRKEKRGREEWREHLRWEWHGGNMETWWKYGDEPGGVKDEDENQRGGNVWWWDKRMDVKWGDETHEMIERDWEETQGQNISLTGARPCSVWEKRTGWNGVMTEQWSALKPHHQISDRKRHERWHS